MNVTYKKLGKRRRRKPEFGVGQVVRVTRNTSAPLRCSAESRAMKGDLLTLTGIRPLIGKWCFGEVRLSRGELRPLTKREARGEM